MITPSDDQVMFSTVVRAAAPLWRAACWVRVALLAGIWLLVGTADAAELPRAAAQLLLASAGVFLAFAHLRPETLNRLAGVPGLTALSEHLAGTGGRATVDASGLAEGIGGFLAVWIFVGPLPVAGLDPVARSVGVVLVVLHVWSAVLQAVVDPGWYSVDHPPSRAMRRFRAVIPLILCVLIGGSIFPMNDVAAQVPVVLYLALTALPLLYHPLRAVLDVLLRAAASHARSAALLQRQETAVDLHSQVKNAATLLLRYVEEDAPSTEEVRSLAREMMLRIEEMRGNILTGGVARTQDRSFGRLWDTVMSTVPHTRRERCVLEPGTRAETLSNADHQIARRVVPDLLTNAMNADAQRIVVSCSVAGARTVVRVVDDGRGLPPAFTTSARSSLALLDERLAVLGGGVLAESTGGRTTVTAAWVSQEHSTATSLGTPAGRRS